MVLRHRASRADFEPFPRLVCDGRDQVEVLVDVEDGQTGELRCRDHGEAGYRRSPVVATFGEQLQDGQA